MLSTFFCFNLLLFMIFMWNYVKLHDKVLIWLLCFRFWLEVFKSKSFAPTQSVYRKLKKNAWVTFFSLLPLLCVILYAKKNIFKNTIRSATSDTYFVHRRRKLKQIIYGISYFSWFGGEGLERTAMEILNETIIDRLKLVCCFINCQLLQSTKCLPPQSGSKLIVDHSSEG